MYYVNYSYLRDRIYLFLLCYYNEKELPTYVKLARKCGYSRQTISKKIKELQDAEIMIPMDDGKYLFVDFLEEEDIEKEEVMQLLKEPYNNNELGMILLSMIRPETTAEEVHILLDVHENTLNDEFKNDLFISKKTPQEIVEERKFLIFGIEYQGKIAYLGATQNYEFKIRSLMKEYPNLKRENFIIMREEVNNYQCLLRAAISLIKPEFNK